ncbi:response regulator [Bacteroides sp. 214]|uniref:ATP-binding protein n=1 Tax=Bacteroides sp. 214 TaxID=2302935 RepID=UPI0013D3D824|nr:ATP-binding protein [Bacteroides sp. 214]NDW11656.1 response regulator [Bacteroides sp. 214]
MTNSVENKANVPFAAIFTAYKYGILEYDLTTEKINFINNVSQIIGISTWNNTYTTLEEFNAMIHPKDLPGAVAAFNKVIAAEGETASIKYRLINTTGDSLWVENNLYSYGTGKNGKPLKVVSALRNIQEEQEEHIRLEKEVSNYRNLMRSMQDFVFVFDEELTLLDIILPEGLNLFHDPQELIGQNANIIYTPEVCELLRNNIKQSLDSGEVKSIEYPVELIGTTYYYRANITPIENRRVFVLFSDISDRIKRMQNLLEARLLAEEGDRMKTSFIANMSHEIRTPLNAIIGFTEIIAAEEDPARRDEYLEIIHTNNGLLLQLVNDILDLSLIESGRYEIHLSQANIHSLIGDVANTYRNKVGKHIELKVVYPDKEKTLLTDPNRVKQVLFNFLSNAVKNTTKGTITLGAEETKEGLRFFVSDTGRGIPQDKLKSIFTRFEKVNSFSQGTGLGLSIADNLVKHLGGEIVVDSEVGKGSTFSFTIAYADEATILTRSLEHTALGKGKKILVVEESEARFLNIQDILKEKHELIWAKNGSTAVNSFIQERPDLILIDILIDDMKGPEIMKRIRSMSNVVPIIGITSANYYLEEQWAKGSGCNETISYPFSASKLRETIMVYI